MNTHDSPKSQFKENTVFPGSFWWVSVRCSLRCCPRVAMWTIATTAFELIALLFKLKGAKPRNRLLPPKGERWWKSATAQTSPKVWERFMSIAWNVLGAEEVRKIIKAGNFDFDVIKRKYGKWDRNQVYVCEYVYVHILICICTYIHMCCVYRSICKESERRGSGVGGYFSPLPIWTSRKNKFCPGLHGDRFMNLDR